MVRGCLAHSDELGLPGWGDSLVGPGQAEGTPSTTRAVIGQIGRSPRLASVAGRPGKDLLGGQSAGHFGPALIAWTRRVALFGREKGQTVQVPAPRHGCDQPVRPITALMPGSR